MRKWTKKQTKTYDKIPHIFVVETLNELGTERNPTPHVNDIDEKPTANSISSGKRWTAFYLRIGTRQKCQLLPFLSGIVQEDLASDNTNKRQTD